MGLFSFFNKKEPLPKKVIQHGHFSTIVGLKKKFQGLDEIKLGKTILTSEEKKELLIFIEENKSGIILDCDFNEFQEARLKSNNKIMPFVYIDFETNKFEAHFLDGKLNIFKIIYKSGDVGYVRKEEQLMNLEERLKAMPKEMN
jgi:hypothetical protein